MKRRDGELADLLEVVDHEEDVGVAHLGLFPFAVHGMLAGRRKHFLSDRVRVERRRWVGQVRVIKVGYRKESGKEEELLPDTSSCGRGYRQRLSVCRPHTSRHSPAGGVG